MLVELDLLLEVVGAAPLELEALMLETRIEVVGARLVDIEPMVLETCVDVILLGLDATTLEGRVEVEETELVAFIWTVLEL